MKKRKNLLAITALIATITLASCSTAVDTETLGTTAQTQTNENVITKVNIRSVNDLNNKLNLGCQLGTTGEDWFSKNINGSNIIKYKTTNSLIDDLVKGNVDAVIMDELPANYYVGLNKQLEINNLKFPTEEYAFAFSKDDEFYRFAVNDSIRKFSADGTFDTLKNTFMPSQGDIVIPDRINPTGDTILKVGTCSDFHPFEYTNEGELVGYDITLAEMIAQDNGWGIEFIDMDFRDLATALEAGEIDMVAAAVSLDDDRLDTLNFSLGYFESEQVIINRK